MIVCAGESEQIRGALPIGVGLLQSAITINNMVQKHNPKELIFVGSAGSYGRFDIFETITSHCASQVEVTSLLNLSYTPLKDLKICNVSCETMVVS